MAPTITIHAVRHAEGFHNLCIENHALPDPDLTEKGKEQCIKLKASFAYHDCLTHLVASPMRRTIYTCLYAFSSPRDESSTTLPAHPLLAIPQLQEVSKLPCDIGTDPEALAAEFSRGPWREQVDLHLVRRGWNDKSDATAFTPTAAKLARRAAEARVQLRKIGRDFVAATGRDAHIVVVTHGGFLHYFSGDWQGHADFTGTGWTNTEWRSYCFVGEEEDDERAALRETSESRHRRGFKDEPLTDAEQIQQRAVAENEWQLAGFQNKP